MISGSTLRRAPQNVVERIGMLDWAGRLRANQRKVECGRDPAGDLVLQSEQIAYVSVEPLCPKVCVARRTINWTLTRTWLPDRLTLPSST